MDEQWRGRPVSKMAAESARRLQKRLRDMSPAESAVGHVHHARRRGGQPERLARGSPGFPPGLLSESAQRVFVEQRGIRGRTRWRSRNRAVLLREGTQGRGFRNARRPRDSAVRGRKRPALRWRATALRKWTPPSSDTASSGGARSEPSNSLRAGRVRSRTSNKLPTRPQPRVRRSLNKFIEGTCFIHNDDDSRTIYSTSFHDSLLSRLLLGRPHDSAADTLPEFMQ